MSYEEKGTWVYLVTTAGTYAVYLVIVLTGAGGTPLAERPYQATLLWSIGAAIVVSVVGRILFELVAPSDDHRSDTRDKEIGRAGDVAGNSLLAVGALAALAMALAEWPYFWIANAVYLSFVLAAVVGSIVRLVAYRRGL